VRSVARRWASWKNWVEIAAARITDKRPLKEERGFSAPSLCALTFSGEFYAEA